MKPIVVVGSINADLVTRSQRLPGKGETVAGDSFEVFGGGKGANQAVAVARLAHPVRIIGMVGSDSFGRDLLGGLKSYGVDTGAVEQVAGASGVAVIQVEQAGDNRITVVAGANAALLPESLVRHRSLVTGAAMVLTQLEIPMATVESLGRLCHELAVPLMLDPAPAAPLSGDLLRQVDWLTPNLTEAHVLLDQPPPAAEVTPRQGMEIAEALLRAGSRRVAVKLGGAGVAAVTAGESPVFVPAFPVDVKDTTAAGDAFNAGFAVALVRGLPLAEALRYGSAVAALSVTRSGAQPSMPAGDEVEAFLREHAASG